MPHPTADASLLLVVDTASATTTTSTFTTNMNMTARRKRTRRRQRQRLTRWPFSVALLLLPVLILIASSSPVAAQIQTIATADTASTNTRSTPPTHLSDRLLNFIETVAQLEEAAANPSLDTAALETVIADLEFNRLRSFWEAPSGSNDFSQALLGNKDNTCYAVYKGRSIPTTPFRPDAQTLPFNLDRQNCDADTAIDDNNDCLCQGHWDWVERNFQQSWQNQLDEMERCMNNCARAFGSGQCELVMGGHGQGGQVAQLLSLHFANSDIQPFVISTGAASVLYNDDCLGFNSTRYVRLINTYSDSEADIGVCFDDVPFIGRASLKDIGYAVVLGTESSGTSSSGSANSVPSIALGPTTNLGGLVVLPPQATRSNRCRFAHEQSLYQEKVEELVRRNPTGTFLESGFSNGQYCEVDGDCLAASICEINPDVDETLPVCIDMDEMIVEPDPTPSPTRSPTPSPTRSPTPSPTRSPTPSPTKSPTSSPTSPPVTASPTTKQPTAAPTQSPSSSPTIAPTVPPTTPRPTEPDDTPFPTELPSDSPSRVPTTTPSQSPSALPTDQPTTAAPVMYPTTLNPTEAPTTIEDDATIITTSSPTEDGGEGGDTSTFPPTPPVNDDEDEPLKTLAPTDSKTPAPTVSSNIPFFKESFDISMVLFGVTEELQGFTRFTWEGETSEHISDWILLQTEVEDVWNPPLLNLRVVAKIIDQYMTSPDATLSNADTNGAIDITSVESGASTTSRQGSVRRNLQSSSNGGSIPQALAIDFEVDISYRTFNRKSLNTMNVILQAFESEEGQTQYIQRLRDTNDRVLGETLDLFLEIQSSNAPDGLEGNGGGGGDNNQTMVWVLVGAAVAAVVVSISLFAVYLKRADDKKQKGTLPPSSGVATTAVFEQPQVRGPRYSQEIVVDPNADDGVSTIGDPTFYPGFSPMLNADEPTASVSYARNYLTQHYEEESNPNISRGRLPTEPSMVHTVSSNSAALSKVASGLTGLNESAIFTDNDSFEEQFAGTDECFEVSVPPGKLGVIVDLSENGEPIVRAIKPDSILADEVKIGDRLLSVDGEGCSEMSAEQVSRLIAMKAGQPYRKIMFCRKQSDYM